jgi:hypothetical protein
MGIFLSKQNNTKDNNLKSSSVQNTSKQNTAKKDNFENENDTFFRAFDSDRYYKIPSELEKKRRN